MKQDAVEQISRAAKAHFGADSQDTKMIQELCKRFLEDAASTRIDEEAGQTGFTPEPNWFSSPPRKSWKGKTSSASVLNLLGNEGKHSETYKKMRGGSMQKLEVDPYEDGDGKNCVETDVKSPQPRGFHRSEFDPTSHSENYPGRDIEEGGNVEDNGWEGHEIIDQESEEDDGFQSAHEDVVEIHKEDKRRRNKTLAFAPPDVDERGTNHGHGHSDCDTPSEGDRSETGSQAGNGSSWVEEAWTNHKRTISPDPIQINNVQGDGKCIPSQNMQHSVWWSSKRPGERHEYSAGATYHPADDVVLIDNQAPDRNLEFVQVVRDGPSISSGGCESCGHFIGQASQLALFDMYGEAGGRSRTVCRSRCLPVVTTIKWLMEPEKLDPTDYYVMFRSHIFEKYKDVRKTANSLTDLARRLSTPEGLKSECESYARHLAGNTASQGTRRSTNLAYHYAKEISTAASKGLTNTVEKVSSSAGIRYNAVLDRWGKLLDD